MSHYHANRIVPEMSMLSLVINFLLCVLVKYIGFFSASTLLPNLTRSRYKMGLTAILWKSCLNHLGTSFGSPQAPSNDPSQLPKERHCLKG